MKKTILKLCVFLMVLCFAQTAFATSVLYDWYVDVDGGNFYQAPYTYMAPTVGGEITNVTGFATVGDPGDYEYDIPSALGSLTVTYNPGAAGTYFIDGFFDVEIDEWLNTWFNETGGVVGSAAGWTGSISNPSGYEKTDAAGLVIGQDVAFNVSLDFSLSADEYAVATFALSGTAPQQGPYLWQTDPDSDETLYLSATLDIRGGQVPEVPEPATILLFGIGLLGIAGTGRKRKA